MKLQIFAIGRIKSRPVQQIVDDYISRLRHYLPIEIFCLRDEGSALSKIGASDFFIVLDERGKQFDSAGFAKFISGHMSRGTKRMVMFIGGPDGAGDKIKKRANEIISLSKMTFPHELFQTVLLEQIYRACTIIRGEAYHRGSIKR